MSKLQKYQRRPDTAVTAVQLLLETKGFTYEKWGGTQTVYSGDWIVNNNGEIYTIEAKTFAKTYQEVETGRFVKSQPVWARLAEQDGKIKTKEGETYYNAGDMIVFNGEDETDGYAIKSPTFERLYQPTEAVK